MVWRKVINGSEQARFLPVPNNCWRESTHAHSQLFCKSPIILGENQMAKQPPHQIRHWIWIHARTQGRHHQDSGLRHHHRSLSRHRWGRAWRFPFTAPTASRPLETNEQTPHNHKRGWPQHSKLGAQLHVLQDPRLHVRERKQFPRHLQDREAHALWFSDGIPSISWNPSSPPCAPLTRFLDVLVPEGDQCSRQEVRVLWQEAESVEDHIQMKNAIVWTMD